jgi:ribosomal protein S18 acetylase RimI-like enzyme
MSEHVHISIAAPKSIADFKQLSRLAGELTAFHGDHLTADPIKLQSDHGTWFHAVLAGTPGDTAIGFAGWYSFYDVQKATRGIELQNLFVDERWRARKIGFKLVQHVAAETVRHDCAQLRIGVRKDNARAIAFYTQLGCEIVDRGGNWICRLNRDKLHELLSLTDPAASQLRSGFSI